MQTEIDNALAGLKAEIQREIFNHRGDDAGRVRAFVTDIRAHRERYATKFSNMRGRADANHFAAIDAAATKAANLANEAIDAAEKAGRVEFA
jgi:hypothetical protein